VTKYLGVDCGLSGALAVVERINGIATLVDCIDMPVIDTDRRRRIDSIAAAEWIALHGPVCAFIEVAQSMPRQGVASTFAYGRAAGTVEAVIALHRIPITFVQASSWKRKLHLAGRDKEAARALALRLFPRQHELLARKSDHHKAEAALVVIASLPS
jgi:crossover junction endodeoxyribonuclease RuvC